jgi:ATP-binding cassette subfamily F protein 3
MAYLCKVLALNDFSFEFAGRYLFKNASWHIKPNEKIGLVGLNGTGKSTLLRLISGDYELREGTLSKPSDLRIGFLNQDLLSMDVGDCVRDVVLGGREDLVHLESEIDRLIQKIEIEYDDVTMQRLADAQERFGALGGYEWHAEGDKILEGLGFPTSSLDRPLREFSGGWRMRAMLGKLLLQAPDLLLLDEPTNHLDLPTIQWLEDYLANYEGTYVIVSHDPYFLDRTVNRIAEVAHQQVFHYKGNYNEFLEQKEERDALMMRKYENQQDYIRQQMKFISRFRAKASKATAVQSRVKMLDKIEKIEVRQDERKDFDIRFNIRVTPGKVIADLKDVTKSYGDLEILKTSQAQILRGDKIALVGANGKGKSTVLRMVHGSEPAGGIIEQGWNVESAFFAQHQLEALNLKNDLLNELATASAEYTDWELRTVLGCFLFTGDEVFKKVKVLSGGEKSRLALAKTLITQSNFLLLDEPTNHLDMFSTAVLAESLIDYAGSCLFVSHDRTFISKVANKIWWIEDGYLKEYPGTFEEYNEWNSQRVAEDMRLAKLDDGKKKSASAAAVTANKPSASVGAVAAVTASGKSYSKNEIKKVEDAMNLKEQEMNALAEEKTALEVQLHSPEVASSFEKVARITESYESVNAAHAMAKAAYEQLFEEWMMMQDS